MAGRRLVHAAKLFHASCDIAHQHIALRSRQYDVYSRTSTLTKAVRGQKERITLTLAAAIALSKRFGEISPFYAKAVPSQSTEEDSKATPRAQEPSKDPSIDHMNGVSHYSRRSGPSKTAYMNEDPADEGLKFEQRQGPKERLPDGTIPSTSAAAWHNQKSKTAARSSLPQLNRAGERKISNGGIAHPNMEDNVKFSSQPPIQTGNQSFDGIPKLSQQSADHQPSQKPSRDHKLPHSDDKDLLSSAPVGDHALTFLGIDAPINMTHETHKKDSEIVGHGSSTLDHIQLDEKTPYSIVSQQDEIPEDINTDIFHSRRVARMLGTDRMSRKEHVKPSRVVGRPEESMNLIKGRDNNVEAFQSQLGDAPDASIHTIPTAQRSDRSATKNTHEESEVELTSKAASELSTSPSDTPYALRESKVPSSRIGRFWQYAGLGTSMVMGAVGEGFRRITGNAAAVSGSVILSPSNMETLVSKLSRMRGAALKLGQMISFQDIKMLPPAIHDVLQRVQDSADYMPAAQRNNVLASNLGTNWRDLFVSFDEIPIAAASIGQVHKAILRSTRQPVAVKVQYPGVANSIDSDLSNLSILLTASRLLPKGLFLDRTIANARTELGWECNYEREADCQMRFRSLLEGDSDVFTVPKVFMEASGKEVLTAELMHGSGVTKSKNLTQDQRDWIGTQILRLCLREIVEFRFMQTDPNWSNFLYNDKTRKIELLDFGACRDYPNEFIEPYVNVLVAASKGDRQSIRALSVELGYLTGDESPSMLEAHVHSVLTLAEPFSISGPAIYDFRDQTITDRVRDLIPVMVRERLAPPPEETYSLHRKLSGAFLLCARLGSRVPCRELFANAVSTVRL